MLMALDVLGEGLQAQKLRAEGKYMVCWFEDNSAVSAAKLYFVEWDLRITVHYETENTR